MERGGRVDREVERGLAGPGRLKILRLLMRRPDHAFTRYEIGKHVPNDPVSIRNDLETLTEIGWVTTFKIQHLTKYSINLENEVVRELTDFLHKIGYIR